MKDQKISIEDLTDVKEFDAPNPTQLIIKQEAFEIEKENDVVKNKKSSKKNDFFDFEPETELERKIMQSDLKAIEKLKEAQDFKEKSKNNIFMAEFEAKMRRIKKIKSKTYRRLKRRQKVKEATQQEEISDPGDSTDDISMEDNEEVVVCEDGMVNQEETEKRLDNIFTFDNEKMKTVGEYFTPQDEFQEKFVEDKKQVVVEEQSKTEVKVLPGWGNWGGLDIEVVQTPYNTITKGYNGVPFEERKDADIGHVIINEKEIKINKKYFSTLPKGVTEEEYKKRLKTCISKETNSLRVFNSLVIGEKPKDKTKYTSKYRYV